MDICRIMSFGVKIPAFTETSGFLLLNKLKVVSPKNKRMLITNDVFLKAKT